MSVTIGSLFSGADGLARGLESVGLGPVLWQAESDEACRRVLRRHYPRAMIYGDVRAVDHEAATVDVICGGSPCQGISNAGRRAGMEDERSGLWSEFARIVAALRPGVVFFENVGAIVSAPGRAYCACGCQRRQAPFEFGTVCGFCGRPMGAGADQPPDETALGTVLGDLAALGYDAVWTCVRASDIGAPHRRERLFLLAYSDRDRVRELHRRSSGARGTCSAEPADDGENVANAAEFRRGERIGGIGQERGRSIPGIGVALVDADSPRRQGEERDEPSGARRGHIALSDREALPDPDRGGRERVGLGGLLDGERPPPGDDAHGCDCPRCYVHRFPPGPDRIAEWDGAQPAVRSGDAGVPSGLHRRDALRMLGNVAVPQQAALAWDILVREVLR